MQNQTNFFNDKHTQYSENFVKRHKILKTILNNIDVNSKYKKLVEFIVGQQNIIELLEKKFYSKKSVSNQAKDPCLEKENLLIELEKMLLSKAENELKQISKNDSDILIQFKCDL